MLRNVLLAFLPYVFLQHTLKPSVVSMGSLSLELIHFNAVNKEIQQFCARLAQR
jgi:hypothetical protein